MNDTIDETDDAELSFEQAVELARKKWKAAEGTIIRYGDGTWISIGDHYDLNLFVDIEDPDKKVQAHLFEVVDRQGIWGQEAGDSVARSLRWPGLF